MQLSAPKLSPLERGFINNYQGNFPLEEKPFAMIAEQLSCTEDQLILSVNNLKNQKLLSRSCSAGAVEIDDASQKQQRITM